MSITMGLLVTLEALPGKEAEVEEFLVAGRSLVEEEPATVAWFAVRLGPTTFAIVDFFPDDAGRTAHLQGKVGQALAARADELFAKAPDITQLDVVASKLP
ncbi:antibiotic biosynthesis monooxygenase [Pseudonocardia sp. KRD-184]|uniref:Antibiotic biosynthesis monooxygenase n=1 Tax=Pseudonocardia oceani TaxID=2792013 RepID=A0ABS6UH11_9PSEU|nr:antibiotic biosynthesis monooxygenase [Pseudonocardia oceani]MBW0088790.1 antibiotic biosynthesis monooxygenase [Pseudonocardia oceani]MBW0096389.1 antibiotic biosynthesis monooxygenase [Pseudonocardia oceani]MBW0107360.1 antibiotic biosynthesis monooxygenase [Pseudonocardia oceani]MBW0122457.1 antibiotic biosynthesis monooxygenase [Pseudonocardia oceani]MBW0131492.1 antibiotic biosynthesis monooxygenase [Pseudonocardia oceani]